MVAVVARGSRVEGGDGSGCSVAPHERPGATERTGGLSLARMDGGTTGATGLKGKGEGKQGLARAGKSWQGLASFHGRIPNVMDSPFRVSQAFYFDYYGDIPNHIKEVKAGADT